VDSDRRRSSALVSLGGEDLVVERSHSHAMALPRVEVVRSGDCATGAMALADGPVLVEGGGSLDRRRVHALRPVDVVRAAVRRHGANVRQPGGRVVRAIVVRDVVLDERVGCPTVEREVRVSSWVEAAAVRDNAAQNYVSATLLEI
jgi:hypothetical protein